VTGGGACRGSGVLASRMFDAAFSVSRDHHRRCAAAAIASGLIVALGGLRILTRRSGIFRRVNPKAVRLGRITSWYRVREALGRHSSESGFDLGGVTGCLLRLELIERRDSRSTLQYYIFRYDESEC